MTPFIGEIKLVPYNFAPLGWMLCAGQTLPIAEHDALFSLIGTTYGGDGQVTFNLPDLRGRVAAYGSSTLDLGMAEGAESVTLIASQMPAHSHGLAVASAAGAAEPAGKFLGASSLSSYKPYGTIPPVGLMAAGAVTPSGGSQPHDNMQPYLVLNYIIAVEGIYPSRN